MREEIKKELNDAKMQLITSSTRTLTMNSNRIYSVLSAIKTIMDGTGVVVPKVDVEAMKATEKELIDLQKKVAKQDKRIENLKEKQKEAVYDARTEEKWKATKEKQAVFEEQSKQKINQPIF